MDEKFSCKKQFISGGAIYIEHKKRDFRYILEYQRCLSATQTNVN